MKNDITTAVIMEDNVEYFPGAGGQHKSEAKHNWILISVAVEAIAIWAVFNYGQLLPEV